MQESQDYSQHQEQMKQREDVEFKKMEKVMKRDVNDMENLTGAGATNAKLVQDKILRTLTALRKITRENNRVITEREVIGAEIDKSKQAVQSVIKKKTMLSTICDTFMNQNFDLYLAHEQMLDDEKEKRALLATSFQEKMKTISHDISVNKEFRDKQHDENEAIRAKINTAIDEYKVK